MPKILSTEGKNYKDVILSDDKPGRRISTTRENSHTVSDTSNENDKAQRIFGNPVSLLTGQGARNGTLLLTFLLLKTKNAGSVFEQAMPGPKGESQG